MKFNKGIYIITAVIFMIFIAAFKVSGADDLRLRIKQADSYYPIIKTYIDIRDAEGNPIKGVSKNQLSAALDSEPIPIVDLCTLERSSEGVGYIFLLDISLSINKLQNSEIARSINNWIDNMSDKDNAAIVTFGSKVTTVQGFTDDKSRLKSAVNSIVPKDNSTQLYNGFISAMGLALSKEANLPEHKVIVVLSDGQDDFPGGPSKQTVLDRISDNKIPIYSIGFASGQLTEEKQQCLKDLEEFSSKSCGGYYESGKKPFNEIYDDILYGIKQNYILKLSAENFSKAEGTYTLKLEYKNGSTIASDSFSTIITSKAGSKKPDSSIQAGTSKTHNTEVKDGAFHVDKLTLVLAGCAVLIVLLTLLFLLKPKKKTAVKADTLPITVTRRGSKTNKNIIRLKFTAYLGSSEFKHYEINLLDSIVIGKNPRFSDLVIDHNSLGDEHIEISQEDGLVIVKSINLNADTFINGVPLRGTRRLQNEDLIFLGRIILRLNICQTSILSMEV